MVGLAMVAATKSTRRHKKDSCVLLPFQIFGAALEQTVNVTGCAERIAGKDDVYVVKVFEF
jgi:hypothetical protein